MVVGTGAVVRATAGVLALLAAACTVEAPDLAGKGCPCAPGWSCDPATNVCVQASGGVGGVGSGAAGSAGGSLGGGGGGGASDGAIVPSNLRIAWTTPESIRWAWDAVGPEDAFLRYELVTALVEADLGDPLGPSARVWTPDDNRRALHRVYLVRFFAAAGEAGKVSRGRGSLRPPDYRGGTPCNRAA